MVEKISISLSGECIAQLEALRDTLHLSPAIRRSTLIQQVIYQCYMDHQNMDMRERSGSHLCREDG